MMSLKCFIRGDLHRSPARHHILLGLLAENLASRQVDLVHELRVLCHELLHVRCLMLRILLVQVQHPDNNPHSPFLLHGLFFCTCRAQMLLLCLLHRCTIGFPKHLPTILRHRGIRRRLLLLLLWLLMFHITSCNFLFPLFCCLIGQRDACRTTPLSGTALNPHFNAVPHFLTASATAFVLSLLLPR